VLVVKAGTYPENHTKKNLDAEGLFIASITIPQAEYDLL